VYLDASSASFFREPMEQVAEAAVSNGPNFSPAHRGCRASERYLPRWWELSEPLAYPRRRRQVVTCKFAGFQARHKPSAEAQAERTGNHQQVALLRRQPWLRSRDKGLWTIAGVVRAPINLVYYAPWGRRGAEGMVKSA